MIDNGIKALFILALFSIPPFELLAQIKGQVVDSLTGEKLAFVNIGIIGKNVGTVSLRDGSYVIDKQINKEENITFSMLGYADATYPVGLLPEVVKMKPENRVLQEVIIRDHELKSGRLGNRTDSKRIYGGYKVDFLGAEIGVIMKIKRSPTYINKFHFHIISSDYDSLRFRVNIYEMDSKQKVGKKILLENIVLEDVQEGWTQVDLEKYNVAARKDFLVSLEWLTDFPCSKTKKVDGKEVEDCQLQFSAGFFNADIYYKKASQGEFYRYGLAGFGYYVDVEY